MHPLDGAYLRVKRADTHLTNLNRRVGALTKSLSESVTISRDPTTFLLPDGRQVNGVLGQIAFPIEPVPHIIKILVGETTYNLRAALDYLVYELARLDSGFVVDHTQFPIDDREDAFKGRSKNYLKGVSDKHIAMVKRLQPFDGCRWTRTLREFSNPDKHRQLTIARESVAYSIPQGRTRSTVARQPVDVRDGLSVRMRFRAGTSIVELETLKQLKGQVALTLDLFCAEFQ